MPETLSSILAAYRSGKITPEIIVARTYERIRRHADAAMFISLRDEAEVIAEAKSLEADGEMRGLLHGIPVAIKDNIDVARMPTTAACPAFSYQPARDATAVARLRAAGALVIGKTNLDQFATGLVGVRSPYGIPRNAIKPSLVPGGSSSGSAVAVAAGIVPLALGTDTAGSGRVPAGLNNVVGLKPSLGLVSTFGVVPACRTLDCVSVFALTVDDAFAALSVISGPDVNDTYSRQRSLGNVVKLRLKVGVPRPGQRVFFDDRAFEAAYDQALARLSALGHSTIEIDFEPFYETAQLLYNGPWVAERAIVARALLESNPDAIHPVTREITIGGFRPTALDTFSAFYKLEELRRRAERVFAVVDALALPTAPTAYTVEQVLAEPIQLNSRLGTYTNFVNLLDLCGLALPASFTASGVPFGITLLAPGGRDAMLAGVGREFHADTGLPLGALGVPQPEIGAATPGPMEDEMALAVVGAHLSGLPMNAELRSCGGRLLEATCTVPEYRLFALPGKPARPGLLRVGRGEGAEIEVEVWALPSAAVGRFIGGVPAPLSIGTVSLRGGKSVKGFLVEAQATYNTRDITEFGGWRAYLAATTVAP